MMYLSDSGSVIKAQHIKLADSPVTVKYKQEESRKKSEVCFVRGISDIPGNEEAFKPREDKMDNDAEIEATKKLMEEKIKVATKEAYDRGFSEGVKNGIDQEKRKLASAAESVTKMTGELKALKEKYLEDSEKDLIDLVFLIARSVIHKEVNVDRDVVLAVLRDAMKNIHDKNGVRIRLNPEDHCNIMESKPDFLDGFGDILIEMDEEIGQGGVLIETPSGIVDARLDEQLGKIMETLKGS